ncbi:MAG: transposase, partial [Rhodobacteraceae bacterium]|nr:transposase [Paracoccaceae bacterium]
PWALRGDVAGADVRAAQEATPITNTPPDQQRSQQRGVAAIRPGPVFREWPRCAWGCHRASPPRCWVHKTANVTHALPKSRHDKAKSDLQDIWMAETKTDAAAAFDLFVKSYGLKDSKAVGKLTPDKDELFAIDDFPVEQWKQIRTTNPVESVFATVRNRTRKTALIMVYKLMMSAKSRWRRLSGSEQLADVIKGVEFQDGIRQLQDAA